MKRAPEPEFVAFIGIDWADAKHDVCLQPANASEREFSVIVHRPEAIEAWAQELKLRFQGGSIAVCLELTKGPLVSALLKYDFLVLFPVNPSTLAKYRQAFTPSRAKDDPTDAELQLDLLLHHPDKLKRLEPPSRAMRTLQHLVEQRRGLVDDRRRITNQLTCALKQYFPQALDWFAERDSVLFCDFLERWPTLKQVKHARKATLEAFFREHNVRYPLVIEKRIRAIKTAMALTEDLAVILPHQLLVQALVDQLRVSLKAIARFDAEIETVTQSLPDYALFRALPGAGPAYAPRLLAAFGERRDRFPDAAALQKYSGIAPVTERSGKKHWVHWRLQCPKFLRQTFVEWAAETIPRSFWAGAYYQQQRAKGCSHQVALRALAFKWVRILYRCWQTRTPYDESTYLNALKRRGSPLLNSIAQPPVPI